MTDSPSPAPRKRGAQPGNRNAFKHGFYMGMFRKDAQAVLRRARRLDPHELKEEIATMRTKMYEFGLAEPDNLTTFVLAGRLLVKMVAIDFGLSRDEENAVHESLQTLIRDLAAGKRDDD